MTEKELRDLMDTLEVEVTVDEEGHSYWNVSDESYERVVENIMEMLNG